jgi:quercetin dioxygenase-like cupin family protein/DNA-binding XRE family transcriptional regulator
MDREHRYIGELRGDAMNRSAHAQLVGQRLRSARLASGLTQADVSLSTGLSLSFIRLVETGRSDISLSRLLKWTTLFGLPVAELFTDPQTDDVVVVRPDDRVEVPSREAGVHFVLLSPGGNHDMEPAIFELAPGGEMHRPLTHEGEETGFVLRGQVRVCVGERVVTLSEGDSVYYSSRLPHRFANAGRTHASLLVTTTHPRLHARVWPSEVDDEADAASRSGA